MADDELRHLSPEEVVALVRRLERLLAAAEARKAELEAELTRRGGPPTSWAGAPTPTRASGTSAAWPRRRQLA